MIREQGRMEWSEVNKYSTSHSSHFQCLFDWCAWFLRWAKSNNSFGRVYNCTVAFIPVYSRTPIQAYREPFCWEGDSSENREDLRSHQSLIIQANDARIDGVGSRFEKEIALLCGHECILDIRCVILSHVRIQSSPVSEFYGLFGWYCKIRCFPDWMGAAIIIMRARFHVCTRDRDDLQPLTVHCKNNSNKTIRDSSMWERAFCWIPNFDLPLSEKFMFVLASLPLGTRVWLLCCRLSQVRFQEPPMYLRSNLYQKRIQKSAWLQWWKVPLLKGVLCLRYTHQQTNNNKTCLRYVMPLLLCPKHASIYALTIFWPLELARKNSELVSVPIVTLKTSFYHPTAEIAWGIWFNSPQLTALLHQLRVILPYENRLLSYKMKFYLMQ